VQQVFFVYTWVLAELVAHYAPRDSIQLKKQIEMMKQDYKTLKHVQKY
jgi:hypothetical protein